MKKEQHKQTISDLISNEEIESWENEDGNILINADTGTGKTYFITNVLSKKKKLLYLCNRVALLKQVEDECNKLNVDLDAYTYQTLEADIIKDNNPTYEKKQIISLNDKYSNKYDYIILDEAHYFINDCYFNKNVRHSYKYLFEDLRDKKKILITATSEEFEMLSNTNINSKFIYRKKYFKSNYSIKSFENAEHISFTINNYLQQDHNHKIIIFCKSKKDYKNIVKIINDKPYNTDISKFSIYLESKIVKEYKDIDKKIDRGKKLNKEDKKTIESIQYTDYKKIINKNKFDSRILFTTSWIDNGVSLDYKIDEQTNLPLIIIFDEDINTIVQEIGRVRIDKNSNNEKLYIFIKNTKKGRLMYTYNLKNKEMNRMMKLKNNPDMFSYYHSLSSVKEPYFYIESNILKCNELLLETLSNRKIYYEKILDLKFTTIPDYLANHYFKIEGQTVPISEAMPVPKPEKKTKPNQREIERQKKKDFLDSIVLDSNNKKRLIEFFEGCINDNNGQLINGSKVGYYSIKNLKDYLGIDSSTSPITAFKNENYNSILRNNDIDYFIESDTYNKGYKKIMKIE